MEIKVQAMEKNIIPFHRPTEKEIEVVSWVNQPNILRRNEKAKAYSESCHEDKYKTLGYFVSGALVFLAPFAVYILGTLI